jgi:hypothetical protein
MNVNLDIRSASLSDPDCLRLIAALDDEIRARYSEPLDEALYFRLDEDVAHVASVADCLHFSILPAAG